MKELRTLGSDAERLLHRAFAHVGVNVDALLRTKAIAALLPWAADEIVRSAGMRWRARYRFFAAARGDVSALLEHSLRAANVTNGQYRSIAPEKRAVMEAVLARMAHLARRENEDTLAVHRAAASSTRWLSASRGTPPTFSSATAPASSGTAVPYGTCTSAQ